MLKRWTNPYLICILSVIRIALSIVGDNSLIFLSANSIFFLIMFLTNLRALYDHERIFSNKRLNLFCGAILIHLLFSLFNYFGWFPNLRGLFLVFNALIKIGYFVWGWLSIVHILIRRQKVTGQTIALAITGYLFIGIIWSFLYYSFWEINPHSFHIDVTRDYELKSWNLAMYFSLTNLTTVGYGDIIPVYRWLMVFSTFEAIVGLIYMAVIIARLVSLYSDFE